jgi:P27 family predicted phage terminase small subunit
MPQRKKTTAELIAGGTYSAGKHGKRGEIPGEVLVNLPPPPCKLNNEALAMWKAVGNYMIEQKTLKATDLFPLAAYCREFDVYEQCSALADGEIVVQLHNKVTAVNHYRKAAEQALKNIIALGDRLGLNPRSRHGLRGISDNAPDDKPDPLGFLFEQSTNFKYS